MKNALSRSIEDPVLAEADVIPTSTMQVPAAGTGHPHAGSDQRGSRVIAPNWSSRASISIPATSAARPFATPCCPRSMPSPTTADRASAETWPVPACSPARSRTIATQPRPPPFPDGRLRRLRRNAEPTRQLDRSRQGRRTHADHSPAQSRSAGQPGARGTGIPPGPGAPASA